MTYPLKFRHHVLSVRKKEGLTFEEASDRFSVGIASLTRWSKKLEPKQTREGRPRKVDLEALAEDVRLYPDAYQYERAERFCVAPNAIFVALKKLNVSYKKKPNAPQSERRRSAHLPTNN